MSDRGLVERFELSARRHPDLPALVAGGRTLTYRELAGRVAAAARRLDAVLPPGARVGVAACRDVATYVAYLGVLRTSRTIVPLDLRFPAHRVWQMLDRAQVGAVLGPGAADPGGERPWRAAGLLDGADLPLRVRDAGPAGTADAGGEAPVYILFTSGTTGAPKGIPVLGRAVEAFLDHLGGLRPIGPGERVSQCFDLTFDPSVADMFGAWAAGGTVVVPTAEQLRDPVGFVGSAGIAHWSSVPSVVTLAHRMRRLAPGAMPGLRTSLFAGEALTLRQARQWREAAVRSELWNAYGPTEMTIFCAAYRLPARTAEWPETSNATVPIGALFPGVEGRVGGRRAGGSGRGELWTGGPQRFAGYLDPADDEGAFTAPDGGPRMYRTGDTVEETPHGLVHLGRVDQQVKVHGYRVELTEVEGALRSHPSVDESVAAVVAGELVAVWTGAAADPGAVLDAAARRVPPYMVPARLEHATSLPLNRNGKIDRAAVVARLVGHDRAEVA